MKIEKFLICVEQKLLNYPDIHFPTLKLFFNKFIKHLSNKERERWQIIIQMIMEYTSKQITIDSIVYREKTKQLDNQLIKMKKVNKKL